jgi:hypothetical protein
LAVGVLADFHSVRQDGGVPAFWDGWYTDRALAMDALQVAKLRAPALGGRLANG